MGPWNITVGCLQRCTWWLIFMLNSHHPIVIFWRSISLSNVICDHYLEYKVFYYTIKPLMIRGQTWFQSRTHVLCLNSICKSYEGSKDPKLSWEPDVSVMHNPNQILICPYCERLWNVGTWFWWGDGFNMLYLTTSFTWNDSFVNIFATLSYLMQGYLYVSYSLVTLNIYNS